MYNILVFRSLTRFLFLKHNNWVHYYAYSNHQASTCSTIPSYWACFIILHFVLFAQYSNTNFTEQTLSSLPPPSSQGPHRTLFFLSSVFKTLLWLCVNNEFDESPALLCVPANIAIELNTGVKFMSHHCNFFQTSQYFL